MRLAAQVAKVLEQREVEVQAAQGRVVRGAGLGSDEIAVLESYLSDHDSGLCVAHLDQYSMFILLISYMQLIKVILII